MIPPLDHLTILSRAPAKSAAWYGLLLPLLGFEQTRPHIWRRGDGLHVQFGPARPDTPPYERYGAGINHIGFRAPDVAFVEQVTAIMQDAGQETRLQRFDDGTVALFLPDPDGFRVEVSWYPPGTPPVD